MNISYIGEGSVGLYLVTRIFHTNQFHDSLFRINGDLTYNGQFEV